MFGNSIYSTGAKPGCRSARHGGERGRGSAYGSRGEFGGGPFGFSHRGGGPFGGFGPGGGPRGPRERGRRARRGDIRTAALLLLAEEPRNGYQIMQEVQERSGGMWSPSPGSVYPALAQLEDEGLIRTEESDGRKLFAITDEGRTLLAERGAERPAPWEQTGDGAGGMHELGRLMREVASAFMQVMRTGSEGQVAKAAGVLAGTRRDLYRILADGDTEGDTGRDTDAGTPDSGDTDTGGDADTVDTDR
jgi:DNA-binding PadR family transcriptional regulator